MDQIISMIGDDKDDIRSNIKDPEAAYDCDNNAVSNDNQLQSASLVTPSTSEEKCETESIMKAENISSSTIEEIEKIPQGNSTTASTQQQQSLQQQQQQPDLMAMSETDFLRLRECKKKNSNNTLKEVDNDETNKETIATDGRLVMNCCAICLGSYEVGDAVVWSSNQSDCQHVFHEDCMVEWMCKMQCGTPCPMCRQNFLPELHQYYNGKYIKAYNSSPPEQTFPIDAISWW
jgi:Ring finger domain